MGAAVPIARRNLLADKVKFFVALGGVTLAVALILVEQSLYEGVRRENASFIRSLPGDLWVTQRGAASLIFSNSFLTDRHAAAVETIPGVTAVHRLYGRLMSFGADEEQTYVWALAPGGTLTAAERRAVPEPGTIVVDRSFAKKAGLSRGDVLSFGGTEFTVADIGHIANVILLQFAFVYYEDFNDLAGGTGAANFFLVSLGPGATVGTQEEIARRVEGSSVYSTDEFIRGSEESARAFLPTIRVVMVISFIVGLAVLSLTIYSATIERTREYGIMKVLGASPLRLYHIVLGQSAIIAFLGFGAGVGGAFLFNRVAGELVPQFVTYIRWQDVGLVLGVAAVMTFVASFVPINRVARVDPASVFRA